MQKLTLDNYNSTSIRDKSGKELGQWWGVKWEGTEGIRETAEWRHPIAGMHVRRTDKIAEAPFRDVSEYMDRILKWWAKLSGGRTTQLRSSILRR